MVQVPHDDKRRLSRPEVEARMPRRRFTEAELLDLRGKYAQLETNIARQGRREKNRGRDDRGAGWVEGWCGEWTFSEWFGLEWEPDLESSVDPGWDIEIPVERRDGGLEVIKVEIKSTPGWCLLIPQDQPARWDYVVHTLWRPPEMLIAGGTSLPVWSACRRARFEYDRLWPPVEWATWQLDRGHLSDPETLWVDLRETMYALRTIGEEEPCGGSDS